MCQHVGVLARASAGGEEEERGGAQGASEEHAAGRERAARGRATSLLPIPEHHPQAAAGEGRGSAVSPRRAQEEGDTAYILRCTVPCPYLNLNCGVFSLQLAQELLKEHWKQNNPELRKVSVGKSVYNSWVTSQCCECDDVITYLRISVCVWCRWSRSCIKIMW